MHRKGPPPAPFVIKFAQTAVCCLAVLCGPAVAQKPKTKGIAITAKAKAAVTVPAAGTTAPGASLAAAPGFVFRAEKEGRVLFLAGALHRLRRDAYPLPSAWETAYKQSSQVWLESNPNDAETGTGSSEAEKKGLMAGWKNVNDLLTEPTRKILRQHLESRDIKPSEITRMRPWYLGMYLMNLEYERLGVVSRYGVEEFFSKRAWMEDKPVRGLEKASDSVESLSKLSAAEQDRNLSETLKNVSQIPVFYTAITTAWRQGSEKTVLGLIRPKSFEASESWRSIVAARNASWLARLESIGADKPCMVIVGLDHLLGAEGLVRALAKRGYSVSAVK